MVHPGALVVAVESGNLAKVKEAGNAMIHEGWAVNWIGHSEKTKNVKIKKYLLEKAAENVHAKSTWRHSTEHSGTLKRGGSKRRLSRRRRPRR